MRQPRRRVVIRKIGIQAIPRARYGVHAQKQNAQAKHRSLDPGGDTMILKNRHDSAYWGVQREVVTCLSINRHPTVTLETCD